MFLVVAYDIVDDNRRAKVSSTLKNFGQRVQKSVFECYLDKEQMARMRQEVEELIDPANDSILYYSLCRKDEAKVDFLGKNIIYRDEDYFLV